ncbi:MAG: glycosyltransferase family 4 protein [Dehalococcoidia bacterium]
MRIALIVYGSLDQISGGYRYDRELVATLRRARDEVAVISLRQRPYQLAAGASIVSGIATRLAAAQPDLIVQDELCHPSLAWANAAIRRIGVPIVSIVHHLRASEGQVGWQGRLTIHLERRYLASIDGLILNSRATGDSVRALLGRLAQNVVAYPGRDDEAASRPYVHRKNGPLRLVLVGNVEPRKNVETLLDALARLSPSTWRLTIVGNLRSDPAYARAIGTRAAALGMSGSIELTGPLSNPALRSRLARSDVLVQPSWYEGFGMAALEGMRFGLPAIVSRRGGASELVEDGVSGFVVDPADPIGIAERIEAMMNDERRETMSEAAADRYNRHPTWTDSMVAARSFLTALASKGRRA